MSDQIFFRQETVFFNNWTRRKKKLNKVELLLATVAGSNPGGGLIFWALRGEGEQDHGQLLLGDLPVLVEVAALQDRLLEVGQVLGVIVLEKKLMLLLGQTTLRLLINSNQDIVILPFPNQSALIRLADEQSCWLVYLT